MQYDAYLTVNVYVYIVVVVFVDFYLDPDLYDSSFDVVCVWMIYDDVEYDDIQRVMVYDCDGELVMECLMVHDMKVCVSVF